MAGVVVDIAGSCSVISLSSGTKCINGESLSLDGLSLNDCHAEIIVRRALVFWLYQQLENALKSEAETADTILEFDEVEGGFKLKPRVSLHLFISTAPCGDARFVPILKITANNNNV